MSILVSAIITTHNRQDLLIRAVKSVYGQTYKDIELIVVDDASDYRADELLKGYDLEYIYIPKKDSKGGNHARNIGIIKAKGKYVAFLDDDDYWLPTKIEKQVQLIQEKDCELVYCGKKIENVKNGELSFYDSLPNPLFQGCMKTKILQTICCCTSTTMLINREALSDVGLFDEKLQFWQDYELTIRLAQRKPFYYVNELLCVYRNNLNDEHRLTNNFGGWKKAVNYIYRKHAKLYGQLSLKERYYIKRIVLEDAMNRCITAQLTMRYYYYRFVKSVFWSLPLKIKDLIRVIFLQKDNTLF